jgi:quercetin dioxygenase-like cupin family protein
MQHIHRANEFIRNLYEADRIPLLPGIYGYSGVAGMPADMDLAERLGIDLIDMEPGTAFPLHTHPGSHILFVLEGRGTVTIGDICNTTKPGDCYFVPANIEHGVGALDHHRLLSIGFPHKALDDPQRMNIVDANYLQAQSLFAQMYSTETDDAKRQELLAFFQRSVSAIP